MRQDEFPIVDKLIINEKLILIAQIRMELMAYKLKTHEDPDITHIIEILNMFNEKLEAEKEVI